MKKTITEVTNRSEPDPDAPLNHSFTVFSHNIPKLLNFQAVISDELSKDVLDEFMETQYYKELSFIDKQRRTTRRGFMRVEGVGGDVLNF